LQKKNFQSGGINLPPPKKLTDRDIQILEALIKCGTLTTEQVKKIYRTGCYHYKRINTLAERGYLIRTGKSKMFIRITPLGAKALSEVSGREDSPIRLREDWQLEQRANIAGIMLELNKNHWHFMSSGEIKRERGISNSACINSYVSSNGKGYAVYVLSGDPHKHTVRNIKNELDRLIEHGINKAIIFYTSREGIQKFGQYKSKTINELLILPYPYGLTLLNKIQKIDHLIRSEFKGFTPSNRPFADYEKENTFISILVYNDMIKKELLSDYIKHAQEKENKAIIIACLESQSRVFSRLFTGTKQFAIPDPVGEVK